MILTNYEIWICDPRGSRLALLDRVSELAFVRTANDAGWFTISIPNDISRGLLSIDNLVEIMRRPNRGSYRREFLGFLRKWSLDKNNIYISGPGFEEILSRRIVAYNAGSAEADQTDYADDMLKEIFDHNLGADATDTDRQLDDYGLSSAVQLGAAPSITKAFSRRNVLEVMKEICEASRTGGTELYFGFSFGYSNGRITAKFQTYTDQPGMDRTQDSAAPVFFGTSWGNLADGLLTYDYSDEFTVVYAGGQGELDNRTIEEREDTTRSGASVWNRREGFKDARQDNTAAGVQAAGDAALAEGRPKVRFTGSLLDTAQFVYGLDWGFGDRVSCDFGGIQFDAVIKAVSITVDNTGKELLEARIEVDL